MSPEAVGRIWGDSTNWDTWHLIGERGGDYTFHYKESDIDKVPSWVRNIVMKLEKDFDWEVAAYDHRYYELTGKTYSYRIVPAHVEQGAVRVDILRRKNTAKGSWRTWDWNLSYGDVRRAWIQCNWEEIGEITWNKGKSGIEGLLTRFLSKHPSTQSVPGWVQEEFGRMLYEQGSPTHDADSHLFYQLTGKKYEYRILPTTVEPRRVEAEVFRRLRKQ